MKRNYVKPSAKQIAASLARKQATSSQPTILDPRFPAQNAFVTDPARYLDAQCSRRAGKTNGLAIRFNETAKKYPKAQGVYLALTLESAKDILIPVLIELNDRYRWGLTFTDSRNLVTWPNGFRLKILGADMKNFVKRLKGRKHPCIGVDEAQDFGPHLQSLVDDVLTPCIADYVDGWLAITGTPGPVPVGYFYNVTHLGKYGFSHHAWTILENPHMPDPKGFIEDLKRKREWTDDNPTLRREWRNEWVLDTDSLWVRYTAEKNHYVNLPPVSGRAYDYILGVDVGFKDCDALALLAWEEHSKCIYLVEEVITPKQGLTELVEQIKDMRSRYNISKIVMDEGALGKKLAEEMRRRHGIPVQPADKVRKQENVEFLNDWLRLGQFKASKDSRFALDSSLIQIDWDKSTANRIVIKKQPHSDIIDAVLYAFKESPAYAATAAPKKHAYGSKEWADAEQDAMWEAELERYRREKEESDPFEPM